MNQDIFKKHLPKLRNLTVANPRLIIAFSGVPGSGKSDLARAIEARYQGVRVANDDIRGILDKLGIHRDASHKQALLEEYLLALLEELVAYPNGLLILDSSIDRKYAKVKAVASEHDYKIFVIQLEAPRSELRHRIRVRDKSKHNYLDYFREFDRWESDHDSFVANIQANYVWDQGKQKSPEGLYAQLDALIN